MKCDCCSKKRKIFQSYGVVKVGDGEINLCPACLDLAYKIRDAVNDKKLAKFQEYVVELDKRCKKSSTAFVTWKTEYLSQMENQLCTWSQSGASFDREMLK